MWRKGNYVSKKDFFVKEYFPGPKNFCPPWLNVGAVFRKRHGSLARLALDTWPKLGQGAK
jgi:hypothetical protein